MAINRAGGGLLLFGVAVEGNVSACAAVPSMVLKTPRMLSETEEPLEFYRLKKKKSFLTLFFNTPRVSPLRHRCADKEGAGFLTPFLLPPASPPPQLALSGNRWI